MGFIIKNNGLLVFPQMLADSSNWRRCFTDEVALQLALHNSGANLSRAQCKGLGTQSDGGNVVWLYSAVSRPSYILRL